PGRVNDDQPTSHSFEGLAVAPDGAVLVAWIETRDDKAATMLARVTERGIRVGEPIRLDTGETCVCCRVDVAVGPGDGVSVLWRKVFADHVRDMVLAVSRDGGRSFAAAGAGACRRLGDHRVPAPRRQRRPPRHPAAPLP